MWSQIIDFFNRMLGTESWPARWYCGRWTEFHGWLYIISDFLIWAAYFAIPIILLTFITKKKDVPLPRVFWLFGAFILLCGLTHLMDAIIFWWPAYRLSAFIRLLTSIVSWLTLFSLIKVLPQALALKTSQEFEQELLKRKEVEESLRLAIQRAEESEKAKQMFLANMSHEIRTPMNAIIGFATLLEESGLTSKQKEWIMPIKYSGDNLLRIINDILDFSKIEAGRLELDERELNIRKLVKSCVDTFRPKAKEKKLKLDFLIDEKIPKLVKGDQLRINQILLNLLSNAIKFTPQGSVYLHIGLNGIQKGIADIQFSVSDTGIGIPKEKHSTIFESFSQASNSITNTYGGTGLGLSISQKLVELQGGKMKMESIEGSGSVFSFNIPLNIIEERHDVQENYTTVHSKEQLSSIKVLLVEDNELNQHIAKLVLEKYHIQVDIADDGKIAIEKLTKEKYDVVLMDIQMPVMNGYETTQFIRNKMSLNIPIIAMTAHAFKEERDRCYAAGMNDYLSKPFKQEVLIQKIIDCSAY
jgi:signal transduction histidine kinase